MMNILMAQSGRDKTKATKIESTMRASKVVHSTSARTRSLGRSTRGDGKVTTIKKILNSAKSSTSVREPIKKLGAIRVSQNKQLL